MRTGNAIAVILTLIVVLHGLCAYAERGASYSARDFGAKANGIMKDTAAVQKAIDAAEKAGGGTVYFGAGTYLCGSLHLKSNVTLFLDAGATIKGSPDKDDYDPYETLDFKNAADIETTFFHFALIWGEDVERIGIVGHGTIDGNRTKRGGPKPIALKRCRFVEIRGIRLINAPNYNISMLGSEFVNIDGVTILNGYCDGIDPDSCRNVRISNCHIESYDDAIVPKASFSLGERRACENITVTNCYLATECNAFKLGTESGGDFKRIAVTNCVMSGLRKGDPAGGGICLESVDGSNIDGIAVSNVTMVDVRTPIFIRLGNRGRDMATPTPGTLKNVVINNVVATDASDTCSITGIPDRSVEGVTISNVRISWKGGCMYRPPEEAVPEQISAYPDSDMFDALPAYGFYCRHVSGLRLSNIDLSLQENYWRLTPAEGKKENWHTPDGIPQPSKPGQPGYAIVCDDMTGLSIDGLTAVPDPGGIPLLRFVDVRDALTRGCMAMKDTKVFLEVAGERTTNVTLQSNALAHSEKPVTLGPGVDPKAVITRAD
jgi:hypothetical protein